MSINKALFQIQGRMAILPKNSQGHGYKYLDLAGLLEAAVPICQEHGVLIRQTLGTNEHGWPKITTALICVESGESVESEVCAPPTDMKGRNSNTQEFGATATYLRRYALCTALSLVADEDTDAAVPRQMPPKQDKPSDAAVAIKNEIVSLAVFCPGAFSKTPEDIEKTLMEHIYNQKYLIGALEQAKAQVKAYQDKEQGELY